LDHQVTVTQRVEWSADRHPVEVEIGCADAEFLFARAQVEPRGAFVGLEIRADLVEAVNRWACERGLLHLQAVYANANSDLDRLFAPGSVDCFHVNFPDPWFKQRHRKRRLVTPELAQQLATTLRPGGQLFFQSDVWDLALDAMAVFESTPGLVNTRGGWSFVRTNPFQVCSRRERRVLERGLPVWRLLFTTPPDARVDPRRGSDPIRTSDRPKPEAQSR
jgi:tRNA (guanine-N7-)-methyltransferase